MTNLLERARAFRAWLEAQAATLTDDDALDVPEAFPLWKSGCAYKIGDRVRYQDTLYAIIQPHTSQDDWTPDKTPALWRVVTPEGVIPEWVQPTGAHDAYNTGDKVRHNGSTWVSIMDANVYEPGIYGWEIA